MKILFITSIFPPITGGSANVYYNLCRYLKHEVVVLTTWRNYSNGKIITKWKEFDKYQEFKVNRIQLLRPVLKKTVSKNIFESIFRVIKNDLPLRFKILFNIMSIIKDESIDVICFGELYSLSWLIGIIKYIFQKPCIFYIHGEELTVGFGSRLYSKNAITNLKKASAVIAVSDFTRKEVLKKGVKEKLVFLIKNGVDFKKYQDAGYTKKIVMRHNLVGKKILLTVARVEQRKGIDLVIKALPLIRKEICNIIYLVVGSGNDLQQLKRLSREYQVNENVVFAGFVPEQELVSYYHICDIFVMPNRTLKNGDTEGFGLVFLEANACGKPVIGGNAGGVPDAVIHNKTGLLVDGESIEEFVNTSINLLKNKKLAKSLGGYGYERAKTLDWSIKAAEFRKICEGTIK